MGEKELERESKGEPTLHSAVANALFDIIDENDNNQLSVCNEDQTPGAPGNYSSNREDGFLLD